MPTVDLTAVELWGVLSAVSDEIKETERFITDTDTAPFRIDRVRAVRDLAVLESAKKKLGASYASH